MVVHKQVVVQVDSRFVEVVDRLVHCMFELVQVEYMFVLDGSNFVVAQCNLAEALGNYIGLVVRYLYIVILG